MKRIGLFGGSFNPIHNGHIALAQAALRQCGLDEVWLMVSPQNPLKAASALLADDVRYRMACTALEGVDGVRASDYELRLPKPSYTWNTLQHLQRDYPEHTFILLIGGDNWAHFERWSHWQDILRHYEVAVYPRDEHPGTFQVPLLDVSSTQVRRLAARGEEPRGLVPDSIVKQVMRYYGPAAVVAAEPAAGAAGAYSEQELRQLHDHLYGIAAEVIRVCRQHDIPYFLIGGSAIGVHYWEGIIPWDDDIDIGMRRADYERFLQVAPTSLGDRYFLQTPDSEEHTPFWFAKVRENGTLYLESHFRRLPIHHGIFVDVFPFDDIPPSRLLERLQYHAFGFLQACYVGTELWQWRHCGTPQVDEPLRRSFVGCLLTRVVVTLFSKRQLFRLMRRVQTLFNGRGYGRCKNIITQSDIIPIADITPPAEGPFGPLTACVPQHLEAYLVTHYGHVQKHLPKEQQTNHKPYDLQFATSNP